MKKTSLSDIDILKYRQHQKELESVYESLCNRCGACCGSQDGDPCKELIKLDDGTYTCNNYANRLGEQETTLGKKFNCVLIRDVLKFPDTLLECAYRKVQKYI